MGSSNIEKIYIYFKLEQKLEVLNFLWGEKFWRSAVEIFGFDIFQVEMDSLTVLAPRDALGYLQQGGDSLGTVIGRLEVVLVPSWARALLPISSSLTKSEGKLSLHIQRALLHDKFSKLLYNFYATMAFSEKNYCIYIAWGIHRDRGGDNLRSNPKPINVNGKIVIVFNGNWIVPLGPDLAPPKPMATLPLPVSIRLSLCFAFVLSSEPKLNVANSKTPSDFTGLWVRLHIHSVPHLYCGPSARWDRLIKNMNDLQISSTT